ncbi:MAG: ATP-binding protein [Bdellovibrionales bacterium]|nr:ATP-binding protein [Bdellovibrionales bacterium]
MKNNPFNPNSVVKPQLFAGRVNQVFHVVRKMSQIRDKMPSNFVISGERGIGKTALAKLIMFISQKKDKKIENLNFLTTYYTVERDQSFRSVLQSSLNLLTDQLPKSAIDRLSSHLGSFFKDGKFSLGAFGVKVEFDKNSGKSLEDNMYLKDQAISILTNILKGIEEDKLKTKKSDAPRDGVLIVLDEIHNVRNIDGVAQILRSVITTLDMNGNGNIAFLIISYPEAVKKFFKGDPSAKRSFDMLPLEIMPNNEAEEILTKGFKQAQIKYDKQIISNNIDQSGGYPHSIQVLGHNLVEIDNDNYIDQDDWTKAIKQTALELQHKDFSNLYSFNGKVRQREELLNVLALMLKPVSKSDLAKEFNKKNKNIYANSCLPELKKIGAIKEEPETGLLSLQSYLFRSAISLHIASQSNEKKLQSEWYQVYKKLLEKKEDE